MEANNMKMVRLKKKSFFSLIVLLVCFSLLSSAESILDITDYINSKMDSIKEFEMKFMFGERHALGDTYSVRPEGSSGQNVTYNNQKDSTYNETSLTGSNNQTYMYLENQYDFSGSINTDITQLLRRPKSKSISDELKGQVENDSYRHKSLGFYYVYNFDYTMDALKELQPVIEKTARVQKVPKALVTSVLFREMMFLGQEDLLDGVPFFGGKSIGICQIGVENVRRNEQIVHGSSSLISDYSDDEIKEMLEDPKLAVYFCTVQLKARAIQITGEKNINLGTLKKEQLLKVLAEYNQSFITKDLGPIKSKEKYAQETYKYYELLSKYFASNESKTTK